MDTMNSEVMQSENRAKVTIKNSLGLHLRPASQLVKLASTFDGCEITIQKESQTINAKSIMGVIMLAAEQGSELTVIAAGERSEEAVRAIVEMVENGFGEN